MGNRWTVRRCLRLRCEGTSTAEVILMGDSSRTVPLIRYFSRTVIRYNVIVMSCAVRPPPLLKSGSYVTYKGPQATEKYSTRTQPISKMNSVSPQKISRRKKYRNTPYWNFWKVVLAGWLIRYPKVVLLPLGIILVLIYKSVVN